ncbi:MAG TPA: threonine--tRNA ligase [Actinomycetota bacterium]
MPRIELSHGTSVELPEGEPIGSVLPPEAVAARLDGRLVDLSFVPEGDGGAEPVGASDPDGLHVLRHSTAHVMAQAVCDLYPGTRYAIGPPIEDGFYYDFELPQAVSSEDLEKVERRMAEIVAADQPFVREELSREEALERFADQPYKREIIEGLDESEGALGDRVSVYRNDGWGDLCLGPHVPSTGRIPAFKLMKLAGAYWRGDETRQMLTRIYGTAWPSELDLKDYLHRLEEAERRDHRRLGRELDLFSFPEELGPGLAVWHPRGGLFRKQLEDYIRDLHLERGYDLVATPHLARRELWDTSGHTTKYAELMYPEMRHEGDPAYFVKPMNCPFHVLIYRSQTRSYRDLPMRLSELGGVYRYERLGVVHGLLRARGFTQDDSHIVCREDQLVDEILGVFDLTLEIHRTFGFTDPLVTLSTLPGESIVTPEMAERATDALRSALEKSGLGYEIAEGEGSFYGPKVDFHFRDAIGRRWQLTTVQCDFGLPERFDMEYVGEDNQRHRPVMVHRAILGSIERFSGVLIEHYAGAFPLWLAPEQVWLATVADRHVEHAQALAARFREVGLRPHVDDGAETVGKKVRAAQLMKAPYTLVIGDREAESGLLTVRDRSGAETKDVPVERFVEALVHEAATRALEQSRFEG